MKPESMEQARRLYRTIRKLQRRMLLRHAEAISVGDGCSGPTEYTFGQINMLNAIREHGPCTVKELAEALRVSAPSVSTMVDRLVDMGAVAREQSQVDRRAVEIRLLPKAEEAVEACEAQLLKGIAEIVEGIGPEYARMWLDVYGRIDQLLEEENVSRADK